MAATRITLAAVAAAATLAGCAGMGMGGGWTSLVDNGKGRENFVEVGPAADWALVDGALQATKGGKDPSYLLTKVPYKDFVLRSEFWASPDANSGFFLRCKSTTVISAANCYEANIFDKRPDPAYGTAAIVDVAKVSQPYPQAANKWNTMEVTMKGDHLQVVFNGQKTVDVRDAKLASGPLALQWGSGVIKFRKVEIKPL